MSKSIEVKDLSKVYRIGHERKGMKGTATLRDSLSEFTHKPLGLITGRRLKKEEFWALKDINFKVDQGDVVGIIGRNGSGKSTLLKILSRIVEPTTGEIKMRGKVASLLEVGTGFHPELTGRENIFFNGAILGMKRREIISKFDEIVEFSEVEKFLDTPVKFYSSGMYVRLAFAVAAHLEPDILIVDEVLAVGDTAFQKKCLGKMRDVANQGRTVLFVSHSMETVRALCTSGILMQNGEIFFKGRIDDTINRYSGSKIEAEIENFSGHREGAHEIKVSKMFLQNNDNLQATSFKFGEDMRLKLVLSGEMKNMKDIRIDVNVFNSDRRYIACFSNFGDYKNVTGELEFRIQKLFFSTGMYSANISVHNKEDILQDYIEDAFSFEIKYSPNLIPGISGIVYQKAEIR